MGDLSTNFSRKEFACKCGCGLDEINPELIDVLEDLRNRFGGKPIKISSGCRCAKHNQAVGGEKNSMHTMCLAADISIEGIQPVSIYTYLTQKYPNKYGVGLYKTWVHIDVRKQRARWQK